jgi:predicted pore-forming effector associated with SMODS systems
VNVDFRKPSHIWFFAAFLPVASYGIGQEFVHVFPRLPFWVEGISPLTAYGLLFSFFDKVAWHWPIFRWLKIVTVPDVRGRWLGEQTSSYVENGKHITSRVIMEVTQTFSSLQVAIYYKRWSSKISVAQFVEIEDIPTLLIMFDAERKVDYEATGDQALRGVCKLILMPNGTLQGTYFNGAGRHGEATYKRTSYNLAHTFDAQVPQSRV